MIERLANDVLQDEYFIKLNNKAAKLLANNLFSENGGSIKLTEKELNDTLRFADILSNSKNPKARNKAYQLITLLNEDYKANPYYQTFSHSVLAKLGNFPGIEFLKNENNTSELPFKRELEKKVKEFIQAVPDTEDLIFTDSQFELYKKISGSKHFSFSGPTSMGKSFIIKSFIRKVVGNKPPENIVIMVPTRALINQFSIDLNKELKDVLEHYNYTVITNSNVSELPSTEQHYIFVLTPERLLSYLSQKKNPNIAYLFIDEAHKLAAEKDSRAVTAYSAISKALRRNPNLNLYFSSPNVSNPEVFLKLFKKDEKQFFRTIETPVSQNLFFVDLVEKKVTHYLDNGNYEFEPKIVTKAETIFDLLSIIGDEESNIVYCSSRFDAVDKAAKLFEQNQNQQIEVSRNVKRVIRQIKGYIHKDYYLGEFLNRGIGYHFGNLPQIIRNKVEGLFKEREINYVFCTSTLLEGVNLPAKNVFILNNKNGRNTFQPIDFWNLAGRAGRLKHELSGNIICLKETNKDWKKHEALLEGNAEINLNPSVENYIDKKLKKIEQILNEKPDIKGETETMKEILEYIANIISIDTLEIERANYNSEIIKKLIADNKEAIIELAKKKNGKIDVPSSVLNTNNSIKLKIQNEIFIALKKQAKNPAAIKLPSRVTYEICQEWLHKFYTMFHWGTEEKKFKSESQLDYYAVLMNQWINGVPLSQIINESIAYYNRKGSTLMVGYKNGKPSYEVFDNSKNHINILIGNIIDDIESVLRFLFEKYFNNYYAMLVEILGEDNAGVNWATFLEYGTQNTIVIALQNYGLSRHSADYIFKKFKDCLKIEGDKLIEINIKKLKTRLSKEEIEYDEISSILF
ncbi:MAG: DEAD/DEAH box helicase [Algoriphagus sp.]|uniref:DEAD/DEAH box helicase n=1 Tax=Algoriphagus sp. TaxID=1872435 RepID=UPI002730CB4C|nr:DEAD/DEAH box helicase [Algoriphagus sp.]MDP2042255.1 DEAD/DEAH box helicase [Algoriphagus sp.]MDP3473252.1 DEAD/DEAH box helicase [Algoriphagus sp.]